MEEKILFSIIGETIFYQSQHGHNCAIWPPMLPDSLNIGNLSQYLDPKILTCFIYNRLLTQIVLIRPALTLCRDYSHESARKLGQTIICYQIKSSNKVWY